jgi:hypothetical protein
VNYYAGRLPGGPSALAPVDRDRLVKLLGLLGSNHQGERAAAALKADQHLRALGLSWGDIIAQPSEPAPSWQRMCAAILASGRATQWEINFCENLLRSWRGPEVTRKQRATLDKIFEKCRGGEHA